MQAELECLTPDDVNAVIERAKRLAVYHARSGYLLAEAKMIYRKKRTSEIAETIIKIAKESYLSSKAQNALVDSIARDEAYLVDWLDRINSSCVHQLDIIRTIISKEKEEMRFAGMHAT
ncbi:MAG: hypothetical protein LBS36_08885 [Oscillospiraceae bacterium]|nr:hypothetical protein [Oscillospiraceae bacterium]